MDSQIPFFCGDSLECRTVGSMKALEIALENINTKVWIENKDLIFSNEKVSVSSEVVWI